tara:strand:+ start:2395 stop:3153 length:759 start_codon:yes stop_codon:yes gene_type:complete
MLNAIKIAKGIKYLLTDFGENLDLKPDERDKNGNLRLNYILVLHRELMPLAAGMVIQLRKTRKGRDILWGREVNNVNYVENEVIPKLMDFEYLKSLPKNTIGYAYYEMVKDIGIEKLYNQRFKEEETDTNSFRGDIQNNISRHILITHDFHHVLFGYDTKALGESLVQIVLSKILKNRIGNITGFFGTLKACKEIKSLKPFQAFFECIKNCKNVDKTFAYLSPLDYLEEDIDEFRKQFLIKKPEVYNEIIQQ